MVERSDKLKPASGYPFVVVTDKGGIHSGHDDEGTAKQTVKRANAAAEEMGLKTRYSIRGAE